MPLALSAHGMSKIRPAETDSRPRPLSVITSGVFPFGYMTRPNAYG